MITRLLTTLLACALAAPALADPPKVPLFGRHRGAAGPAPAAAPPAAPAAPASPARPADTPVTAMSMPPAAAAPEIAAAPAAATLPRLHPSIGAAARRLRLRPTRL